MPQNQFESYSREIKHAAEFSSIEVYRGLEVDFIPGVIRPIDFDIDYSIGSIHFVDQFADGTHWEIDGAYQLFLKGLEQIFQGNVKQAVCRYFELTRQMLDQAPPTVLGHLDKIKIQNFGEAFFKETDFWYQDQVKQTLRTIRAAGTIVEVNTRGIYQKKTTTTYPSPWIIDLLINENIPVTLSSDAHHIGDLTNQFQMAARMLKQKGLKEVHAMVDGKWRPFDFDENGIRRW